MAVGIGSRHENPPVFRKVERQKSVVFQQDDRLAGRFERRGAVLGGVAKFGGLRGIDKRIFEKSEPELGFQNPAAGFVDPFFGDHALLRGPLDHVDKDRTVHAHVHPAGDAADKSLLLGGDLRMFVHQPFDVLPVANDKALEAHLSAQQVGQQPFATVSRMTVDLVMCSHHTVYARFDARPERRQENLPQRAFRGIERCAVDAVDGLRAAYKMLGAGDDAVRSGEIRPLIAADRSGAHPADQQRVFAERLPAASPTGVASHLDIGVEGPLGAHGPHFERRFTAQPLHEVRVERRGLSDRGRVNRRAAVKAVAVDGVDADDERNLQAAFLRQALQVIGLLGGYDMEKRAGLARLDHPQDVGRVVARVIPLGVPVADLLGRGVLLGHAQVFQTHELTHLPDLFTQGHAAHQVVDTPFDRLRNIFVERFRAVGTACAPQNGHRQQRPSEQSSFHSFEKS